MKKKILALVLCLAMCTALLAGCGTKDKPAATDQGSEAVDEGATKEDADKDAGTESGEKTDEPASEGSNLDPVTLTWYLHGSNVTDDSAAMEKVNEYLKDKLNVTLKPI